jgi:glutamate:GABA antiporter
LSATWPEHGGVYAWVKKAFGKQFGFLAIWFQWVENLVWFPTILSFMAGSVGYLIAPTLAAEKSFVIAVILCTFWGATIINFFSMRSIVWFTSFCTIFGLLLPTTLIISLGIAWFISGKPINLNFDLNSMIPNMHGSQGWAALTSVILSFCGIEVAASHSVQVKNPHRSFPRALFTTGIILLATIFLGSLAIAMIVPKEKISLLSSMIQAFDLFFSSYNMRWILPFITIAIVFGCLGCISNWILAPSKGLSAAADDGHLPAVFKKRNRHGVPIQILIYQAIIVTLIVLAFLLMPTISGGYWILAALATQLYMFMYILLFAAGLFLRFKHPNEKRPFKVPGGKLGMLLFAGAGILGALTTVIIGFIPPANIDVGSIRHYELVITFGLLIMSSPPLFLYFFNKKKQRV